MRKTFCDICGKEVKKQNEAWKYELQAQYGNSRVSYNEKLMEVCEKCATILHCVTSVMREGYQPDFHELKGSK